MRILNLLGFVGSESPSSINDQGEQHYKDHRDKDAVDHFKRASNMKLAKATLNLGRCYEDGRGVEKNHVTAAKYYYQALDEGCEEAFDHIFHLRDNSDISAGDASEIGKMLHEQKNGAGAIAWYDKAIEKGSIQDYGNRGRLYEEGLILEPDWVKAARDYRRADAQDALNRLYGKKVTEKYPKEYGSRHRYIKTFEKERVFYEYKRDNKNFLNKLSDKENNTPLHRAAKDQKPRLKDCARFLLLGARMDIKNNENRTPLNYLNALQQGKIGTLQKLLATLLDDLRSEPAEILARTFTVKNAQIKDAEKRSFLNELYEQKEIKPLFGLAKFAALALHDLAKRSCHEEGYDSDDDSEEPTNSKQYFSISIDADERTVDRIFFYGSDGQKGKESLGVYPHGDNGIFVGGKISEEKRDFDLAQVKGTLVHELTHFLADEIYKNQCKPYGKNDKEKQKQFSEITAELHKKYTQEVFLDPILTIVFNPGCYSQDQWDAELIVRVPQIIITYEDGLAKLQHQAPKLLAYYQRTFLNDVKHHTASLEKRALRDWPKELLESSSKKGYRGMSP